MGRHSWTRERSWWPPTRGTDRARRSSPAISSSMSGASIAPPAGGWRQRFQVGERDVCRRGSAQLRRDRDKGTAVQCIRQDWQTRLKSLVEHATCF